MFHVEHGWPWGVVVPRGTVRFQGCGCSTWNTAMGPRLVGIEVSAAARSSPSHRFPCSSGGSLTRTIPPDRTQGVERRMVVSGDPNPRQVTTSMEWWKVVWPNSSASPHTTSTRDFSPRLATARRSASVRFALPVHQHDPQIGSRHGDHQPGNPCSRAEIGARRGVLGESFDERQRMGDHVDRADWTKGTNALGLTEGAQQPGVRTKIRHGRLPRG
jgi:hypothetical protein